MNVVISGGCYVLKGELEKSERMFMYFNAAGKI